MIQWRKIISFVFHHILKLSIDFNLDKFRLEKVKNNLENKDKGLS